MTSFKINQAGEIEKSNFISSVRSTVHTNLSRKRSFSEPLFKPDEFENAGLASFNGVGKRENGTFQKRRGSDNPEFPDRICLKHNTKLNDPMRLLRFQMCPAFSGTYCVLEERENAS